MRLDETQAATSAIDLNEGIVSHRCIYGKVDNLYIFQVFGRTVSKGRRSCERRDGTSEPAHDGDNPHYSGLLRPED